MTADRCRPDVVSVSRFSGRVFQVALEELQDLKGVWSELSKVWEQIDQMKEQPWVSVQPRKVNYSPIISFHFTSSYQGVRFTKRVPYSCVRV